MELRYNLTIQELMDFFSKEHKGFSEKAIQKTEQTIGVSLPVIYKDFLLKYGQDIINDSYNHIFSPNEICTSYFEIQDTLDNVLKSDYEQAVRNGTSKEEYADNPYFTLWQLPKEQWHTITQNYVLIWCENQGVWNAGFLLQDLLDGKENPPIYLGIDDDIIEFVKIADNIEQFLISMTLEAAGYNMDKYTEKEEIVSVLSNASIDLEKLKACGHIGTCLDSSNQTLYYLVQNTNDASLTLMRLQKEDLLL